MEVLDTTKQKSLSDYINQTRQENLDVAQKQQSLDYNNLKIGKERIDTLYGLIASANDQAGWDRSKAQAVQLFGPDVLEDVPEQFDPSFKQQAADQVLGVKNKMELELQKLETQAKIKMYEAGGMQGAFLNRLITDPNAAAAQFNKSAPTSGLMMNSNGVVNPVTLGQQSPVINPSNVPPPQPPVLDRNGESDLPDLTEKGGVIQTPDIALKQNKLDQPIQKPMTVQEYKAAVGLNKTTSAQTFKNYNKIAEEVPSALAQLDQTQKSLDSAMKVADSANTSNIAEARTYLQSWANTFGIPVDDTELASAQSLDKAMGPILTGLTNQFKGNRILVAEIEAAQRQLPNIKTSKQALTLLNVLLNNGITEQKNNLIDKGKSALDGIRSMNGDNKVLSDSLNKFGNSQYVKLINKDEDESNLPKGTRVFDLRTLRMGTIQ